MIQHDLINSYNNKINDKQLRTIRMMENAAFYSGSSERIRDFYINYSNRMNYGSTTSDASNFFWSRINLTDKEDMIRLHTGLPQLISKKMADLLMSNGYTLTMDNDKVNDRLNEILDNNGFHDQLIKAIEIASAFGGVTIKASTNSLFNEPIIEVVHPMNYSHKTVSGRIIQQEFTSYFDEEDDSYKLIEKHKHDRNNIEITYTLYKRDKESWNIIPLNSTIFTEKLKPIKLSNFKGKIAVYIPNRLPNSEFINSTYGESDYSGSYGLFNALDEVASTWIQEFRDGKLNRYFPSNLLMLDPSTGDYKRESSLKTNHILYTPGISEDATGNIIYQQGDIRTEKHKATYESYLMQICNLAGLSPITLGITGLESIISSAESQQEREKVSIRTRNNKARIFEPAIKDLLQGILSLDNMDSADDNEIEFRFNEYIIKSKQDKINEVQTGLSSGVYNLKTAIDYVHDDKTEDERLKITVLSKIEQGITSFTKEEADLLRKELFIPAEE